MIGKEQTERALEIFDEQKIDFLFLARVIYPKHRVSSEP